MKKHALVNPYSTEVYLVTGCTEEQLGRFIQKTYPKYRGWVAPPADGRLEMPTEKDGTFTFYVWINDNQTKSGKRLTIIHETGHLVIGLFSDVGIPIIRNEDYENEKPAKSVDEAFTYLQEDFCRQIFKILKL